MMMGVLIAGLVFGGESMRRRSQAFRSRAAECRQWIAVNRAMIGSVAPLPNKSAYEMKQEIERLEGLARQRAEHYQQLEVKYLRAARYPWLPVAPDPPRPE
jgi:hypothetical protein